VLKWRESRSKAGRISKSINEMFFDTVYIQVRKTIDNISPQIA